MHLGWLILLALLQPVASTTPAVLQTSSEDIVVDLLTNTSSSDSASDDPLEEKNCNCGGDDLFDNANYTLTTEIKNIQQRLVEPFRDAIAFTSIEKEQIIRFLTFTTLRQIKASYPMLLDYTNFYGYFTNLVRTIENLLIAEHDISYSQIKFVVNEAVENFFKELLPDMFLCLSVGKCRTVPLEYYNCMLSNTKPWAHYIGNMPHKMAMGIAEAIYRYRKVEFLLVDMHKQLMDAQKLTITEQCVQEYAMALPCNCTTYGIGRCKTSCPDGMDTCFGKFSRDWAAKLHLMRNMTNSKKTFLENFMQVKKTILMMIRQFTERKSFLYAEQVFNSCGPLGKMIIHPSKHTSRLRSPGQFVSRAEPAVKELQLSAKTWDRMGRRICEYGIVRNPGWCFDGVKVVSITDHMLPEITKDVRPRPMMDWIDKREEKKQKTEVEGSASPLWDDEDSDDFEGSGGSGFPPVIVDTKVKKQRIEDHPKNIDLSINPNGPSVIVTEQGSSPDGATSCSLLMTFVVLLGFWIF